MHLKTYSHRSVQARSKDRFAGIEERIAFLEARVVALEQSRPAPRPSPSVVLSVIVASVQGRAFNSRELFDHATVDVRLRAMFDALHIDSVRRLGKLLHRLENRPLGSYRLERIGQDRDGVVWTLRV